MKKFTKLTIKETPATETKSTFLVKNLEKGFGITIGNALRRVLLSNIPGASMFAVKISGIKHEFESIPGIKEDAINLVLNLKKLVIVISEESYSDEDLNNLKIESWPTLKINKKGKGIVTAADIECPAGFSIVNKDLYLVSIENDSAKLEVEIFATRGRGFIPFTQNRELINTTGIIPTDSNFSPVLHVQYNVEQTIISKHNVANDLTLVIATDGSVTPKVVLSLASKILVEHFNSFVELSDNISSIDVISTAAGTGSITPATISTPITDLELSVRSFNCLKRQGIHTVQELTQLSKTQIENIKNLGKKSLREIIKILVDKGYELKK